MQHKNIIFLFQPAHLPTINILYGRWHFVQPVWESRSFYHLINANDRRTQIKYNNKEKIEGTVGY